MNFSQVAQLERLASSAISSLELAKVKSFFDACVSHFDRNQKLGAQEQIHLGNLKNALTQKSEKTEDDAQMIQGITRLLTRVQKLEQEQKSQVSFQDLFGAFTDQQIKTIGSQIVMIELTKGCSVACPNCTFNALIRKGPQVQLAPEVLDELISRLGPSLRGLKMLYYASDPLDWDGPNKSYIKLLGALASSTGARPETTTAIPAGKEDLAMELWRSGYQVRFSISEANFHRLNKCGFIKGDTYHEIQFNLGQPGHPKSQVIGAGKDSSWLMNTSPSTSLLYETGKRFDFRSYRDSVACQRGVIVSPDGVFNIVSTAVTPLSPNGVVRTAISPTSVVVSPRFDRSSYSPLSGIRGISLLEHKVAVNPLIAQQVEEVVFKVVANYPDQQGMKTDNRDDFSTNHLYTADLEVRPDVWRFKPLERTGFAAAFQLAYFFQRDLNNWYLALEREKKQPVIDVLIKSLARKYDEFMEGSPLLFGNLAQRVTRVTHILSDNGVPIPTVPADTANTAKLMPPTHSWNFKTLLHATYLRKTISDSLSNKQVVAKMSVEEHVELCEVGTSLQVELQALERYSLSSIKTFEKKHNLGVVKEALEVLRTDRVEAAKRKVINSGREVFLSNLAQVAKLYAEEVGIESSVKRMISSDLSAMGYKSVDLLALYNLADMDMKMERAARVYSDRATIVGLPLPLYAYNLGILANSLILSPHSNFVQRLRENPLSITDDDFKLERQRLLTTLDKASM